MKKSQLNELRDFQLKIGGEYVYLDIDNFLNQIEMEKTNVKEGEDETAVNLPRFEFFKLMLDVALGYAEEVDDKLGHLGLNKTTLPFRLALNTLIEYKIIKEVN